MFLQALGFLGIMYGFFSADSFGPIYYVICIGLMSIGEEFIRLEKNLTK